MDLKARLGRLGARPPLSPTERAPREPAPPSIDERALREPGPPSTDERAPREPAPPPAPGAEERRVTLDRLRAELRALRERTGAAPPAGDTAPLDEEGRRLAWEALPFAEEATPLGPVLRRLWRLPPSHHVGRIRVDAAVDASAALLALLALDPALGGVSPRRALYLDTETTGLGGSGTVAFLVGLLWFDGEGRAHLEQLLLREPAEEPALLALLAERVAAADHLVTFNGKSFDLPLLATRYVMNRLPPLPARPHLDLLHVARRLHRRLAQCRLKELESSVLGFVRGEDLDGAEVAPRYGQYLRTGDPAGLVAVVEHNAWDVVSMASLVGLYGEEAPAGSGLHDADLPALARTLHRAGGVERAAAVAEAAVARGVGPEALRARGDLARARGERDRALADYEALAAAVDDPAVRLALAKLYEHHVKAPGRALTWAERGTSEAEPAAEKRLARLRRKAARR